MSKKEYFLSLKKKYLHLNKKKYWSHLSTINIKFSKVIERKLIINKNEHSIPIKHQIILKRQP